MRAIFIYALLDPRDGRTRYVGQSCRPSDRHYQHMYKPRGRRPVEQWCRGLKANGLEAAMLLLEKATKESANASEEYWISSLREAGFPLLNLSPGGCGPRGVAVSAATKTKISETMKRRWLEPGVRQKYVDGSRIRWERDGEREKARKASTGKIHGPPSEETRRKIGEANSRILMGRKLSPEHRAKVSASLLEHNRQLMGLRKPKTCQWCGETFWVAQWEDARKFCSHPCYGRSKRLPK